MNTIMHFFKFSLDKVNQCFVIAWVIIESYADVTIMQFCWKRMAIDEQGVWSQTVSQLVKMVVAHVKQVV